MLYEKITVSLVARIHAFSTTAIAIHVTLLLTYYHMDFLSKRETVRSLPQCQQEADRRLLAHDTHAIQESQEGVVVYSQDTDVLHTYILYCIANPWGLFCHTYKN